VTSSGRPIAITAFTRVALEVAGMSSGRVGVDVDAPSSRSAAV
jgi:hypothetical protein